MGGGGGGYGGGGRGRLYTYRYTVTTWLTSALSWAAMKAILMFHSSKVVTCGHYLVTLSLTIVWDKVTSNCEGQSHKIVSTDHNFWRERKAEVDSNQGLSA